MKTRTISFCIYGICADIHKLDLPNNIKYIHDFFDSLYNKYNIKDLCIFLNPLPPYYLYIGKPLYDIKNDETGKDFKLSVQNEILKMFPDYNGFFKIYDKAWIDQN